MKTRQQIRNLPNHPEHPKFKLIGDYQLLKAFAGDVKGRDTIEQMLARIAHHHPAIAFDNTAWIALARNGKVILSESKLSTYKRNHNLPVTVSLYKISNHYGGSEEGGWWYDWWKRLESKRPMRYHRAVALITRLNEEIKADDKRQGKRSRTSMAGSPDYRWTWEDFGGEAASKEVPHYE